MSTGERGGERERKRDRQTETESLAIIFKNFLISLAI